MIRLYAKSITSPDIELGVEPSRSDVCVLLQVEIGASGDERADVFSCVVATPDGVKRLPDANGIVCDRALLVVTEFSWELVAAWLDAVLLKCSSQDWQTSVGLLQRYFKWEYEDYVVS